VNWINSVVRPKISSFLSKRETPENLWIKCPETGEMVFHRDLEANGWVIPGSGYHMRMPAADRLKSLFDDGMSDPIELPQVVADPLRFRDERRYTDRLRDAKAKTGREDAVLLARGTMDGLAVVLAVQDFDFMGGSLGMAAGEAIIKGFETALEAALPFVLIASSGGARMQEGILSLMQMPRTTAAAIALKDAGLPYIVVLTNPTTGGVSASYAMLGDIHIAEPGALIGFAGPRVIEQTIREKLPEGFQRAEYLHEHGMVDLVVHRHRLKATIARVLGILTHRLPIVPEISEPAAELAAAEQPATSVEAADAEAAAAAAAAAAAVEGNAGDHSGDGSAAAAGKEPAAPPHEAPSPAAAAETGPAADAASEIVPERDRADARATAD
jgi:acetyl-CoA carboxylase carboxyl transferase subunit beta